MVDKVSTFWDVASSSDTRCLAVVDGMGAFEGAGPHYSRRTPGSKTFTGVGQEIVLLSKDLTAVWAVVRQKTPAKRGTGVSRGRTTETDRACRYVWRNMLFRNLGNTLSSVLIKEAVALTYILWAKKYRPIPAERLRTEIDPRRTQSANPGYCYKMAGFHNSRKVRGKVYLDAPCVVRVVTGGCECCHRSQWTKDDTRALNLFL
jgi:hypothetical protein